MRKYKFRAWAKKTCDHYISDPIEKAYAEFKDSEPNHNSIEWDKWYLEREHRVEVISALLNPNADDRYEITYEMIDNFSINGDGKLAIPYRYEIINVMQSTELKDKNDIEIYEGDVIKGREWSKGEAHRHIGVVTYIGSEFKSVGVKQYYGYHGSVNGSYEIIGNIYENPELVE